MKLKSVALLALLVTAALFAQEFRGTISGLVTDTLGAGIPGAKVTVTETHTGTRIPTVSDNAGQYTAVFLLPGDYDISVQAQGFKSSIRKGVHVAADDHIVVMRAHEEEAFFLILPVAGDARQCGACPTFFTDQADKFELIVNLTSARQSGLTIPEAAVKSADRVVP